jgi:hypothetical protein
LDPTAPTMSRISYTISPSSAYILPPDLPDVVNPGSPVINYPATSLRRLKGPAVAATVATDATGTPHHGGQGMHVGLARQVALRRPLGDQGYHDRRANAILAHGS